MIDDITQVFRDLSIKGEIVDEIKGPAVTRYHVKIPAGSTLKSYTARTDDIALSLGVKSVAIAPIVGTPLLLGMDVPNPEQKVVPLTEILSSATAGEAAQTAFGLGKNMYGRIIMPDIVKMPHLLIAGTTGSGKSVCINTIICSLLLRNTPKEVRFIMIDPKMVELSGYNGIPHLIMPVITDMQLAMEALSIVVDIMEDRYVKLMETGTRNIEGYNNLDGEEKMPRIVVIIDEMADLMMTSGKEIEEYIIRIAQKARACGIHLIVATQRPERVVITGLIKANIPSRIAFMVRARVDSKIILDEEGAENLLGRGDMLYYPAGQSAPERIQGCWIADNSIAELIESLQTSRSYSIMPEHPDEIPIESNETICDTLFPKAVEAIFSVNYASALVLQRKLRIDKERAAQIINQMESMNIVGPYEGYSMPRKILISKEKWEQMRSIMCKKTAHEDNVPTPQVGTNRESVGFEDKKRPKRLLDEIPGEFTQTAEMREVIYWNGFTNKKKRPVWKMEGSSERFIIGGTNKFDLFVVIGEDEDGRLMADRYYLSDDHFNGKVK